MRRILIVSAIAGILLTSAACGAKDESTSTADGPSAKSSEQSTTTAGSPSDDDTTGDDRDTGSGGVGDLPNGLDNDCIAISTLYVDIMAKSTTLMVPGAMSAEDLEKLEKELDEAKAKAEVPDEIADAFEVWATAWSEFGDAMGDMGPGGMLDPANAAKLEEASKKMEDPEVKAASEQIEAYVTENCAGGGLTEP